MTTYFSTLIEMLLWIIFVFLFLSTSVSFVLITPVLFNLFVLFFAGFLHAAKIILHYCYCIIITAISTMFSPSQDIDKIFELVLKLFILWHSCSFHRCFVETTHWKQRETKDIELILLQIDPNILSNRHWYFSFWLFLHPFFFFCL